MDAQVLTQTIYAVLPTRVVEILRLLPLALWQQITEIRLRIGQPVLLVAGQQDYLLGQDGIAATQGAAIVICRRADIDQAVQLISRNSLYAFEHELQAGYITVGGGHRVGIAGQAIIEQNKVKTLTKISSLNFRLAREQKGVAKKVLPYVLVEQSVVSTLIIAPPRCGKTTLLRDLIRLLSLGEGHRPGLQIGLVDERSEIAGCVDGVPSVDLGPRVDVLDGCPKAVGMLMLIRSMSPQVVVTDELGSAEDVLAVREAVHAGVAVIASVHGRDFADVLKRPHVGNLLIDCCFERVVVLTDRPAIGTISGVIDVSGKQNLLLRNGG